MCFLAASATLVQDLAVCSQVCALISGGSFSGVVPHHAAIITSASSSLQRVLSVIPAVDSEGCFIDFPLISSFLVLLMSDHFQMIWIAAKTIVAFVIDLFLSGYESEEVAKHHDMD